MKHLFKPGDIVTIKSYETLEKEFGRRVSGNGYTIFPDDYLNISEEMVKYCGKEVVINSYYIETTKNWYLIENGNGYVWSENCFIESDTERKRKLFQFENLNIVFNNE